MNNPRNKGQRYGKIVTPDEIANEPISMRTSATCDCGVCLKCTNRVYRRVWDRKFRDYSKRNRSLIEPTDTTLDMKALKWLQEHK